MTEKHTPAADEVAAKLSLSLKADSGYSCKTEYRISANTWGDIVRLCEGRANIEQLEAENAALRKQVEELRRDAERKSKWNKKARDLVDSLLEQRGYAPDSSARHNLSLMNFDAAMAKEK